MRGGGGGSPVKGVVKAEKDGRGEVEVGEEVAGGDE